MTPALSRPQRTIRPLWGGDLARADHIHRYPAKMALGLAEYFFDEVVLPRYDSDDADKVRFHDPFCGSGTTLLVARTRGLTASGSDLLDDAVTITRAKVNSLGIEDLDGLRSQLSVNPLTYRSVPRWTWATWNSWYTGRTLRAIQDVAHYLRPLREGPYYPHAAVALSQTAWDVSAADPSVMVPTHSNWARGHRSFKPGTVLQFYRRRLRRVLSAQEALQNLDLPVTPVKVWVADALTPAAWPCSTRVVLCSPPYGLGLDYVRAASMAGLATNEHHTLGLRANMIGRSSRLDTILEPLPRSIGNSGWARRVREVNPDRFEALLQYLIDIERFLTAAKSHLEDDGILGLVIGDPEMSRVRVPLTRLVRDLAGAVGFVSHCPPRRDRIRRRFQAGSRRSSSRPITHETLLCFVPN